MPGAHKTSAVFGPSVTAVTQPTCVLLNAWVRCMGLRAADSPCVFVPPGDTDRSQPVDAHRWCKIVKAAFRRHSGVPLSPKDLRSSFVTFLKSDTHTDDQLRSAAWAMRHSTAQQGSHA